MSQAARDEDSAEFVRFQVGQDEGEWCIYDNLAVRMVEEDDTEPGELGIICVCASAPAAQHVAWLMNMADQRYRPLQLLAFKRGDYLNDLDVVEGN